MNLAEICESLSATGNPNKHHKGFAVISPKELHMKANSDPYSNVVKKALEVNKDLEMSLYQHQYDALYALAEGKDVLLISP